MRWTNDLESQKATLESNNGVYSGVIVHCYKTKWYMSWEKFNLRHRLVNASNLEEAKEEALDKLLTYHDIGD